MIVNRKLSIDSDGTLSNPPSDIDIEERVVWQPWLKSRCNFAVRYIIPNRVNIIKIMQSKNRFSSQVYNKFSFVMYTFILINKYY